MFKFLIFIECLGSSNELQSIICFMRSKLYIKYKGINSLKIMFMYQILFLVN
jgi:hypothetical protein